MYNAKAMKERAPRGDWGVRSPLCMFQFVPMVADLHCHAVIFRPRRAGRTGGGGRVV